MLTVIIILLVLNILLNLAIGFLVIIALGESRAVDKYRFEFESLNSSEDMTLNRETPINFKQDIFQ